MGDDFPKKHGDDPESGLPPIPMKKPVAKITDFLFDFEGAGSPIEPFDVFAVNGNCTRYLPSPTEYGKWIRWLAQPESNDASWEPEEDLWRGDINQFLAEIPGSAMTAKGEDSLAEYLTGATSVCDGRIAQIVNSDRYSTAAIYADDPTDIKIHNRSSVVELPVCTIMMKTLIDTAWTLFGLTRLAGEPNYRVLPMVGEQFHSEDPYEDQVAPVADRWQIRIVCNWEPDEEMFARHEMAYGATLEQATNNAASLREGLRKEWQENLDKE